MPENELRLILGDQLNENHSWLTRPDAAVTYVMMEIEQETAYVKHHVQKIAGFFAAMRTFAEKMQKRGHRFIYQKLDDPENRQNFKQNISTLITIHNFDAFSYLYPDEYRLDQIFRRLADSLSVPVSVCDSEHFFSKRDEVSTFFKGKKQFRMESFYRYMRKKYNILMESGKPAGGNWNYDRENRHSYRNSVPLSPPLLFSNNVEYIVRMLTRKKITRFGHIAPSDFIWPINREQSLQLLSYFCDHLLPNFGTFQDAMVTRSWSLFHSRLSFALNTKMIGPQEVIDHVLQKWRSDSENITLNQVEGFIRQILGWREYMRGIYWALMPEFASRNYFGHSLPLPAFYWDGKTQMHCMQKSIGQSLNYAYTHHIQRLMITGNFALLCGIDPDEVDRWYLGVYIDAIEWVEITNTRGMSQFADGGSVATKPYVSSANYISKMSDYCGACFYDSKKITGERACPFNSLYWHFYHRHQKKLKNNPRVTMMYRVWAKKKSAEQNRILDQADYYLSRVNDL